MEKLGTREFRDEKLGGDQSGRAHFRQRLIPDAAVWEGVDELTLRTGEECNSAFLHRQMETTTGGQRLARDLSGLVQGVEGAERELVLQVRGDE